MAKKAKQHYVDNKALLAEMIKYKAAVNESKEKDLPRPVVSEYIGECIMKIAEHLSYRPNFINYTYKEDMICDGIENCLLYIDNFDPDKSKNPFAYFTQIIYYAFIRRIQKEKKQQHIRHKVIENMSIDVMMNEGDDQAAFVDYLQKNFLPDEAVYKPKKKKTKPKGLEEFYDDEEGENVNEDSTDN